MVKIEKEKLGLVKVGLNIAQNRLFSRYEVICNPNEAPCQKE